LEAAEGRKGAIVIQVPEQQHELDRLAREVADAALKLDRESRDTNRTQWPCESAMTPDRYRYHVAILRYEQLTRKKEKP
jgi:hypothetical protein